VKRGGAFAAAWLQRATRLLDLARDQGLLAHVHFARHLGWFEYRDSDWASAK
jgi:hypothetical protein